MPPSPTGHRSHRNTIFVEEAEVIDQQAYPGDQYILTLRAPKLAAKATPGVFAHLQCDDSLAMRRPMSVMLTDRDAGSAQFLYKATGKGTRLLANRKAGDRLSVMGPIGKGFTLDTERRRPLLLGGGVGIPPMVFIASALKAAPGAGEPLVLMGSEVPFPFDVTPSHFMVPGLPEGVIAAMPLMEDWGFPSRLASLQGYAGCYDGYITDLARAWLETLAPEELEQVYLLACGPTPMLKATAQLAAEFALPCQVSLEEFMACAVGGCAGCTVPVQVDDELAMRRVCVDGPVFDSKTIVWQ